MTPHGLLIAFEGLDQSGKETQAARLRETFAAAGRTVRALSFPDYETPIGREIRAALNGDRDFAPDTLQLLYIANRHEYREAMEEWLADGDVVVCDRYRASSVAYGSAQGLDAAWLHDVQRHLPAPTVVFLLDIAPDEAVRRKAEGRDKFERDLPLLSRVRDGYRRQAADEGWEVIDGAQPKDDIAMEIFTRITARGLIQQDARSASPRARP
ncbi:MAG: dTMP kinase [Acidobacteriota bacterium]|nr:dTMP kinase [Acidobacteriota bacterium]